MEDILNKYNQLEDSFLQKQVLDFIDYLLKVKKDKKSFNTDDFKKSILHVSTWSNDDLMIFEDISNSFNQWTIKEL